MKKGPIHQGDRPKSREEMPKKGHETSLLRNCNLAMQNNFFKAGHLFYFPVRQLISVKIKLTPVMH